MLSIANLSAGYGELEILKGISLHVDKGEIVALIGPNGAGKSTVIKSVFGLAQVRKGKIMFQGKSILKRKTHELIGLGIGYVNQGRIVFGTLTVEENLLAGTETMPDEDVRAGLREVYERFPVLKERRQARAFTLSGGQQQMLALGRALVRKPALLLMDEPSLGLSPKLQKEMFTHIGELRKDGFPVLIVEQNAKKAIEIADRTYLLEDGKIVLEGGRDILQHKKIQSVYLGGRY